MGMGIVMVDERVIPRKKVEFDRASTPDISEAKKLLTGAVGRIRALERRIYGCTMTGGDRADVKATAAKALEQARQAVAILERLAR